MTMKNLMLWALLFFPLAFAQDIDPALVAKLREAATQDARIGLLTDDQFVFNFLEGVGNSTGAGGEVVAANAGNFPALISNGVAMALGFLGPCGLNTPHTHPRATEINVAINGTLRTGMLQENGARFVFNDVPPGSAAVFPQGAIHFEMNTECTPTLFVAGFGHEDPGAMAVSQRLFGIPVDIMAATLNSLGVVEIAELESKLPNNVAQGTDECLSRCGISKVNQPTSQRQPRLPSNPLPSGFNGPPPPPPMPTSTSGALATNAPVHSAAATGSVLNNDNNLVPSVWRDKNVKIILITLLVVNGLFVVGTLAALFFYIARIRTINRSSPVREYSDAQFVPLDKEKDYYDPYQLPPSPTPRRVEL